MTPLNEKKKDIEEERDIAAQQLRRKKKRVFMPLETWMPPSKRGTHMNFFENEINIIIILLLCGIYIIIITAIVLI